MSFVFSSRITSKEAEEEERKQAPLAKKRFENSTWKVYRRGKSNATSMSMGLP